MSSISSKSIVPFKIDINADVGEGIGNEPLLMPYLSSCNIACGGHAGDLISMTEVVRLAKEHHVKIGAHPSFPDRDNFGRLPLNMPAAELYNTLKHQIRALLQILRHENLMLHHIKPHGALYNMAAKDQRTAEVIIEVIKSIALPVKLYAPFNSVLAKLAMAEHIPVTFEAFADRNYNIDGSLVSRKEENAIITSKQAVVDHVYKMIKDKKVICKNGAEIELNASTFCIHSDTKNAVEITHFLVEKLSENNIIIR